jgi:PST family polysaccharide transporter
VRLRLQIRRWPHLFGDSALILAGRVFGVFILVGGSMMLGRYHSDDVVGAFYFALNQSSQSLVLFAVNLDGILFPTLAKLAGEPGRMRQAYLHACGVLALVGVPACMLQGIVADPGIRAVFDPQWEVSIPALAILSFGMAFRLIGFSTQSMVQAQGRFRTFVVMMAAGGVTFGALVWGAARFSDPSHAARNVAIAVGLYFALEGPAFTYVAIRPLGGTWRDVGRLFSTPLGVGFVAAAVGWCASAALPSATRMDNAVRLVAAAAAMLAAYVPLARRLDRTSWDAMLARFAALRRRDPSA